jgi:hypothetical protein
MECYPSAARRSGVTGCFDHAPWETSIGRPWKFPLVIAKICDLTSLNGFNADLAFPQAFPTARTLKAESKRVELDRS